jgi:hypothetical protein
MALPSLVQQRMQQNDDTPIMPYVKYALGESVSTAIKSSFLSLQSMPAKSPLLRMLGGGILAERADIKRRELYEQQGRDPTTGRKLTRAEVDEINKRRQSYGVMGEIRDTVMGIYDILSKDENKPTTASSIAGAGLLRSEEQASEISAENARIRESDRDFWSKLFKDYFSRDGNGYISLRDFKQSDGGSGGGLLGSLLGGAIAGALLAAMAPVVAALYRAAGIKNLPKWVRQRVETPEVKPATPEGKPSAARAERERRSPAAKPTVEATKSVGSGTETILSDELEAIKKNTVQARERFNMAQKEVNRLAVRGESIELANARETLNLAKQNLSAAEATEAAAIRRPVFVGPEAPKVPSDLAPPKPTTTTPKMVMREGNVPLKSLTEPVEQIGKTAKALRMLGKAVPFIGPLLMGGIAAFEHYQINQRQDLTDEQKSLEKQRLWTSTTTGVIGSELGAALGAFGGPIGAIIGSYAGAELGLGLGNVMYDQYDLLLGPDAEKLSEEQKKRRLESMLRSVNGSSMPGSYAVTGTYEEVIKSLESQKDFFKSLWNWATGNGFTPNADSPAMPNGVPLGSNMGKMESALPTSFQMAALDAMRRSNSDGNNSINVIVPTTVNNTTTSNAAIASNPTTERTGADNVFFAQNQRLFAFG